jgi:hypothetical protein
MKFTVDMVDGTDLEPIEVETLEELLEYVKKAEYPVIITHDAYLNKGWHLEIYDNYRE